MKLHPIRRAAVRRQFRPRLERLEDRLTPVVVNLTGTADHDFIWIQLREGAAAPDDQILDIRFRDDLVFSDRRVNVEEINIATLAGDDRLVVSFSNGNPLRDIPLTFNGGDDDDTLQFGFTGASDQFSVAYHGGGGANRLSAHVLAEEMTLTDDLLLWQSGGITLAQATLDQVRSVELDGAGERAHFDASAFTGNAALHGTAGADHLIGGAGNDFLFGGNGIDVLEGGPGNDSFEPARGEANGGPGDDRFAVGLWHSVNTTIRGGEGNDSLEVIGTDHDDRYEIRNSFVGEGFVDVVSPDGRQFVTTVENVDFRGDFVGAGTGNDTLFVDFALGNPLAGINLRFLAGAGDDVMVLGGVLHFGSGRHLGIPFGGSPADYFSATFVGGRDHDRIEVTVADGVDLALTNTRLVRTDDTPPFAFGAEVALDGVDDALLIGEEGNNLFDASGFMAGRATLRGGDGDDWLIGGPGDDILDGGAGDDRLEGGGGNDAYVETPGSFDQLIDTAGADTIDFSHAALGVTVDFLLTAGQVQTVDVDGNQLALTGFFERVVGSPHDDSFHFGHSVAGGQSLLEVIAGAGDDQLQLDVSAAPGLGLSAHLGDGADRLSLRFLQAGPQINASEFLGQIAAGAGADVIHLTGSLPRKLDLFADLGVGDDVMSWSWTQPAVIDFQRVHVDAGDGDDTIDGRSTQTPPAIQNPVGDYLLELGFGNDKLNLDCVSAARLQAIGGDGNEAIDARFESLPALPPPDLRFDLGFGADWLRVNLSGLEKTPAHLEVSAGPDDDHVALVMPRNVDAAIDLNSGHDLLDLSGRIESGRVWVRAGLGNDRLDGFVEAVGLIAVPNVAMFFDLQDGDDIFDLGLALQLGVAGQGQVNLGVRGGSGSDTIDATVDITGAGPEGSTPLPLVLHVHGGGGHDEVSATVDYLRLPGPGVGPDVQLTANLGTGNDVLDVDVTTPDSFRLRALAGSGADVVNLVGVTAPTDNHWNVFANLGAGHDELSVNLDAAAASSASMGLTVLGGAGNDVVDLVGVTAPGNSVWEVWVNLGGGADTAVMGLTTPDDLPPPQGTTTRLNAVVNGGSGNDTIEVHLESPAVQVKGRVRVRGNAGNDALALFADDDASVLSLLIDGGLGNDTCEKRGKVTVLSC